MRLRLTTCTKVVAALAVAVVAVAAAGPAHASNMGFKLNKVLTGTGAFPIGRNEVALPFKNPYASSINVCTSLALPAGSTVQQVNAQTGGINSTTCPAGAPYNLLPKVGIRIATPSTVNAIIVGSDIPGSTISLFPLGAFPKGNNFIPVLYHTTAVTAENLCTQFGLTSGTIQTFNAATGNLASETCGGVDTNVNLRLGESVLIRTTSASTITATPAHF
jgi:hypothetical protein